MATKTIAWESGGGYITLTYTGKGSAPISVQSDANDSFDARQQVVSIVTTEGSPERAVDLLVKQKGKTYPVGTVFNFDYTGTVQEVTLPPGRYKLQCWGAQGGDSYDYDAIGSKGGYSEGEITLTQVTTLYVFVGGMGSTGSSTAMVNGGWNGGGGCVGRSTYSDGEDVGYSYPACGGGATDIATVTSDMSYSGYHTNRSEASLLSRCIVAGGGGGATAIRREVITTTSTRTEYKSGSTIKYTQTGSLYIYTYNLPATSGLIYEAEYSSMANIYSAGIKLTKNDGTTTLYPNGSYARVTDNVTKAELQISFSSNPSGLTTTWKVYKVTITTSTDTTDYKSNEKGYGGGTSGGGYSPGGQQNTSSFNVFGYGQNQTYANRRYVSGAGGGGWYGGSRSVSNLKSAIAVIQQSGSGGSGFVNIADNADCRPDGYTGLELDSGTTTSGGNSFPSPSGGNETGHSGNGYARITKIE